MKYSVSKIEIFSIILPVKTALSGILCFLLISCGSATKVPPVTALDIDKYSGVWYEIARYDHIFERNMENVSATYTINSDGSVNVLNKGIKDGKEKSITGKAYRPADGQPGILKVVFFVFGSEYRVIYLDSDYKYAVVTSDTTNYLWILARSAKIEKDKLDFLIKFINENGFDSGKLIFVKHN